MKWLVSAAREIFGLFVEDLGFTLCILAWVALAGLLLRGLPVADPWRAAIFLAGCLALLVENVVRAARGRRILKSS